MYLIAFNDSKIFNTISLYVLVNEQCITNLEQEQC
jgi:hypothetical protein